MKRLFLAAVLLLGACALNENLEPPAELVEFEQTATLERVWDADVGDLEPDLLLGLVPATDGENVYVANHEGEVHAFRLADGSKLWTFESDSKGFWPWSDADILRFSAGPAVANGFIVAGTIDGTVAMLDAATGEARWRVDLDSELLAPPLLAGGLAVLMTVDARVVALDLASGERVWSTVRESAPLSIRGLPTPATNGRRVFVGFDTGRVAALSLADGNMIWEETVALPGGTSELEAIVDVNGALVHLGNEVYATSYNGNVTALAAESGEILWRRELSSARAPAASRGDVFVTDIDSEVHAFDRLSGTSAWTQNRLRARSLTAPAVFGDLVAVGDFEGYVHFLDADTGEMRARIEHGGEPVQAQPLVAGDLLIVLSADGRLAAYRRARADTE